MLHYASINASVQAEHLTRQMNPASAGKYTSRAGSSSCSDCSRNSYAQALGSSACLGCPHGTFQPLTGQVKCELCSNSTSDLYSHNGGQDTGTERIEQNDSIKYCRRGRESIAGLPVIKSSAEPPPSPAWLGILATVAGALCGTGVLACGCWCAWKRREKTHGA